MCDRCFGQQTNLDRHLKKHESDGPTILDEDRKRYERRSLYSKAATSPSTSLASSLGGQPFYYDLSRGPTLIPMATAIRPPSSASSSASDHEDIVIDEDKEEDPEDDPADAEPESPPPVRSLSCEVTIRTEKPADPANCTESKVADSLAAPSVD